MKSTQHITILSVALAMLAPAAGHAQVSAGAKVATDVVAASGIVNTIVTGAGGGVVNGGTLGTLSNSQWIMGQSTVGPSVTSYDACTRTRSGSLLSFGIGWSQTDENCEKQRQAEWLRLAGLPAAAAERMCDIEGVRLAIARTNGPQCAQTVAERAQNQPTPVAAVTPRQAAMAPGCRVVQPGNYVTCQ